MNASVRSFNDMSFNDLVSAEIGLLLTEMEPRLATAHAHVSLKTPECGNTMYDDIK